MAANNVTGNNTVGGTNCSPRDLGQFLLEMGEVFGKAKAAYAAERGRKEARRN